MIIPFYDERIRLAFIPHGHCYLWQPDLVWLHAVSDGLIALAYFSIPVALVYFVQRRRDLPYPWIFQLFGVFITTCGLTHLMEIWTLWYPTYWVSGGLKAVTAIASLATASALIPIIPKVLTLPSPSELEAARRELEQEVHARTQSLRQSEERLHLALKASGEGLWDWNISTGDVYLDARYQEMLGYAPGELLTNLDTWKALIHPDDRSWVIERLKAHLSNQSVPYAFDYRVRCKSGEWKWVADYGKVVAFDDQGNPLRMIGIHIDISDRKATEAALAESRQRYQDLVENSPDVIERFDLQLRHLYVSPVLTEISGIGTEVFLGKTCRELGMDGAMVETWEAAAARLIATGERQAIEFSSPTVAGERFFEMAIAPEWGDDRALQSILCISRDITDRKLTEEALKTQRDFNQLIAEITSRFVNLCPDDLDAEIEQALRLISQVTQVDTSYVFRFDEDGGTMSMTHEWSHPPYPRQISSAQNLAFAAFPWAISSLKQREVVCVANTADLPSEAAIDRRSFEQLHLVAVLSIPLIGRSGVSGMVGFASFSRPITWDTETVQLLSILARTIASAQQQAQDEQALAISEERLRLALTAANQGLYDLNIQTGEAIVSPEYALMLGYDPATFEETNARWIDRLHPDDREAAVSDCRAYLAGALSEYKVEFRQRTYPGDYKWILSVGKIVAWDASGQPLRMLGTYTDITERKQAEEARLQAEKLQLELNLLERILNTVLAGYWDTDFSKGTNYWSSGLKRMFGYGDSEVPDWLNTWQELIFAEDLPGVQACFDRHVRSRGKEPYYNEVRYRHKNGSTVWVICAGEVIEWDAEGQPLRMIGCHVDITRLKQAEAQIQKSEAHLRQAQRISKLGSWQFELATEEITWSHQVFHLFGKDPAEGPPKSFEELQQLIYDDDREFHQQTVQTLIQTGQPFDIECRVYRADGTVGFMQSRGEAVVDATGQVIRLTGTVLDIMERKQAEMQLRMLSDRLTLALQAGAIGTWDWDLAHGVNWDARMYEIYGIQHLGRTALYQDWLGRLHPDDQVRAEEALQAALRGERDYNIEFRICHPDDQKVPNRYSRWIKAMAIVRRDEAGNPLRMTGINYEITERKQTEAKILQTTAQLEASNRELEAFAYSVSHDLRAPLRAIDGFSKALLEDYGECFDDGGKDYFNRIRRNVQRMGMLIDDLLRLSRVSRSEMQYTTVDLSRLVRDQIRELQAADPERSVECVVAPAAIVSADLTLMRVAITNLLENAWKFTSHHSSARIEFGIIKQNGDPVYFVRDDGAGFDMAFADKLFGVFQRLHNTHEFPGTGIGLATVQRAIHRHGGQVWAEGIVEQGATVYFTLPGVLSQEATRL